jgi:hypothetical protein
MSENGKKLRAALLVLGVNAPKSWNEQKLASELEKAKILGAAKQVDVETKQVDVETKQTFEKKLQSLTQELEQDEDLVEVVATADFSNKRLNITRMKPKQTARFSAKDAKFLVEVDRTCKYVK